ncbi:uncharacterized protein LOC143920449 [Arctopsyche grandis]|uniref:uncharacterized protein LOC143920449 n=1 Tax=Arctopsyche grandis TaxID=121162 RepID=UPI00406D9DD3
MEDSGIDSGDAKPICDIPSPVMSPNNGLPGAPPSRLLHRRLGSKNRNQEYKKPSGSLLPLQRLPIPGTREQQPLVAWDTDESEEELVSFFGNSSKNTPSNHELADFSVEELSPTDEDEDGDDLELVVPSGPVGKGPSIISCCGPKLIPCCLL